MNALFKSKFNYDLIGSRLWAFQWAEDEQRTLPLTPSIRLPWKFWFARWRHFTYLRNLLRKRTPQLRVWLYTCFQTVCMSHSRSTPKRFNIEMPFYRATVKHTHSIAVKILSVCLSVRPSVCQMRVLWQNESTSRKKFNLWLIGSRPQAFQWA